MLEGWPVNRLIGSRGFQSTDFLGELGGIECPVGAAAGEGLLGFRHLKQLRLGEVESIHAERFSHPGTGLKINLHFPFLSEGCLPRSGQTGQADDNASAFFMQ